VVDEGEVHDDAAAALWREEAVAEPEAEETRLTLLCLRSLPCRRFDHRFHPRSEGGGWVGGVCEGSCGRGSPCGRDDTGGGD
jgi:hypothetical protein